MERDGRRPFEIIAEVGKTLAREVGDFSWVKSAGSLRRRRGDLTDSISLQGSRYNRTGERVVVSTTAVVRDKGLAIWRRAGTTVVGRSDDWLFGHPLGYLLGSGFADGEFDLTTATSQRSAVSQLTAAMRPVIDPWFALTEDPEKLVRKAPIVTVTTSAASLVDWLVRADRPELLAH